MNRLLAVLGVLALAGCASKGTSEDFWWSIEVPATVDKGAEFQLTVKAKKSADGQAQADPEAETVGGVPFHYQIHWTGGSSAPLRHLAYTDAPVKVRARMVPGPATILITAENRDGLDVKVLERAVEVK